MWDYDKMFAEGNIVGLTIEDGEDVYNQVISNPDYWEDGQEINWDLYKNEKLSSCEETGFKFRIQYIICLDKHGNVVEKLFDRERDMAKLMPELETGMFVRVVDNGDMEHTALGYVDIQNCRIIYQDGKYSNIVKLEELRGIVDIVEVYSQKTNCFNQCFGNDTLIWRDPDYQAYLDSKSNQITLDNPSVLWYNWCTVRPKDFIL